MKASVISLSLSISVGTVVYAQDIQYPNPFKHVIVVFQENRTPDNLFQGLCSPPYGNSSSCSITPSATQYDIQTNNWLDKKAPGGTITPGVVPLGNTYDLSHAHSAFIVEYDGGKMDGAAGVPCSGSCPPNPQFRYVDNSSGILNPYLDLATQYGWGNNMFQTNQGPSYPAHQFIFGGTSAPSAADDSKGIFVAENPGNTQGGGVGCLAPLNEYDWLISPGTAPNEYKLVNNPLGTLCFSRPTMATLIDKAKLTWKYYTSSPDGIWTAPNTIREICDPNSDYTKCTGPQWVNNVDKKSADVLSDIAACKLADVSWVIPAGQNSDHPGSPHTTGGPSWVASIVNAVGLDTKCEGGKGYWSDTAIVITWDDWGGWYDHVPPPILKHNQSDYQYGIRVPLIVVSTYTPERYINNVSPHDFGSILRFIEGTFGIKEGSLGFADARASNDLEGFFNFKQTPRRFKKIAAEYDANYFLNDTSPPEPPDND
ncbi:MAG: hypothetical protein JOY62_04220 [Acidobacteriaceae bacterium]|nr:hypothetical protein [Acidobacteriaceae bacterium]MBV9779159.1 hypothetical protein [Acidobacteriaceae bacterium]